MSSTLIFALLLIAQVEPASRLAFPETFSGVWDASAEACADRSSDMRIQVDSSGIHFWESDGTPVDIETIDDAEIRVALAMTGEGERWTSRLRLVLDRSGALLFREDLPGENADQFVRVIWLYHRCPEGTPMGW